MQQIGQNREGLLDRNPGAYPRRARDGRVGPFRPSGAPCLWSLNFTLVVFDPFSWRWWVGEKTEGLFYETTEGASKRAAAHETSRAALPARTKGVLRLHFTSLQNGENLGENRMYPLCKITCGKVQYTCQMFEEFLRLGRALLQLPIVCPSVFSGTSNPRR